MLARVREKKRVRDEKKGKKNPSLSLHLRNRSKGYEVGSRPKQPVCFQSPPPVVCAERSCLSWVALCYFQEDEEQSRRKRSKEKLVGGELC